MKNLRRAVSLIIAAAFVFCCLPAFAVGGASPKYPTPEGYSDNDYQKLVAFLEIADEEGVRNGEKIDPDYDPLDPETWCVTKPGWYKDILEDYECGAAWEQIGGVYYAKSLMYYAYEVDPETWDEYFVGSLVGYLDVSGLAGLETIGIGLCELVGLDASGCASLDSLSVWDNCLTEIELEGCSALDSLNVWGNELTELDLSQCPNLTRLACSENMLTEIDLSCCPGLTELFVTDNHIRYIDLSGNEGIFLDSLRADGDGFIGFECLNDPDGTIYSCACAEPDDGAVFIGWYNEEGEFVSEEQYFGGSGYVDEYGNILLPDPIMELGEKHLVARFAPLEYDEYEITNIRAFLELTDGNGVKNGEKINEDYDPDDPETWWAYYLIEDDFYARRGFFFIEEGEEAGRLSEAWIGELGLVGELDLSGCEYLADIYCYENDLTALLLNDCPALTDAVCFDNPRLMEIDVMNDGALEFISCGNTAISSLDLSTCEALTIIDVRRTRLTEVDLTGCPLAFVDLVSTEGGGYVGIEHSCPYSCWLYAEPEAGYVFDGWYTEDGGFISDDPNYGGECTYDYWGEVDEPDPIYASGVTKYFARFTPAELVPGDANGDGVADMTDVLLVMRCVLGLQELPESVSESCDVNGDGVLNLVDALLIMRSVLGIEL